MALAALASVLYNVGVALQALEARGLSTAGGALVASLARRPRWLAGTALGIAGWPLQGAALALAPLTAVQPALAIGLLALLAMGTQVLGERVAVRDAIAVVLIVVGVGALAAVSPEASTQAARPVAVAGTMAVLAAFGVLAGVVATLAARPLLLPVAAGAGFAAGALTTKLLVDALARGATLAAVAWAAATALCAGVGLLGEMAALRTQAATRVAPVVLVVQVVVPVLVAPLVANEPWTGSPVRTTVVIGALIVLGARAASLSRSAVVRQLVDVP